MSEKRRVGLVRLAIVLLVIGTLAIVAIGNAVCSPEQRPLQSTNKALVAKLVSSPTKTVVPDDKKFDSNNNETISTYWIASGAMTQGFSLTAYTKAVQKLNRGQNVNVFRSDLGWKVPWGPWPEGN
jgi:competence protein ComGC